MTKIKAEKNVLCGNTHICTGLSWLNETERKPGYSTAKHQQPLSGAAEVREIIVASSHQLPWPGMPPHTKSSALKLVLFMWDQWLATRKEIVRKTSWFLLLDIIRKLELKAIVCHGEKGIACRVQKTEDDRCLYLQLSQHAPQWLRPFLFHLINWRWDDTMFAAEIPHY